MPDTEKNAGEKTWSLRALEVRACPFFNPGDTLRVRLPGIYADQKQLCSLPIATFLPLALGEPPPEGSFPAGYKRCACTWAYGPATAAAAPADTPAPPDPLPAPAQPQLPFLAQLPEALARTLKDKGFPGHYRSGDVILKGNAPSEGLHLVQRGRVRVSNKAEDGRILEITVLRAGDCFGEMSLLSGQPASGRVDAIEDCTILTVPRRDFFASLAAHPSLALVLYRMLAERLRVSNHKLARLMSPGLAGDLAVFGFIDLVQTIGTGRMTGALKVRSVRHRAEFGFAQGRLVHARAGDAEGSAAIDAILGWKAGSFQFHNQEQAPPANLSGDTMGLLLEALRRRDEGGAT